jgi:hypothetical protein
MFSTARPFDRRFISQPGHGSLFVLALSIFFCCSMYVEALRFSKYFPKCLIDLCFRKVLPNFEAPPHGLVRKAAEGEEEYLRDVTDFQV